MSDSESLLGSSEPSPRTPFVVYLYVCIAAFANLLFGYENSVVASGVNDYFSSCPGSDTSASFLKGALALGATVACPLAGFLQDGLGRRITLIICCIVYIGVCIVTSTSPACSAAGFPQMATGRFLTGMVIGVFSSTVPMYIAELSPPSIRGALVTVNQVCICVGILLGYISSTVLKGNWVAQFLAATPLSVLSLLAFVFVMPYSPRWLMSKGRQEEALRVLEGIYGKDSPIANGEMESCREVCRLNEEFTAGGKSRLSLLLEPHILWSVGIGVMGALMQQWVGVNAVNAYAPNIFMSAGRTSDEAHVDTIYIGVAKLVFVVVALYLMDKAGRKPLLLIGCVGMVASSTLLAASYSIADSSTKGRVAVASLVLYMAFFEISLGPILWLLLSELYPVQVKGVAMSIGACVCWFMTYVVNQSYTPMAKFFAGLGGNAPSAQGNVFYFFAAVSAASTAWIYFYIFETKGRSLEEIQELLKGGKASPRAATAGVSDGIDRENRESTETD